jgi:hypothetical protein
MIAITRIQGAYNLDQNEVQRRDAILVEIRQLQQARPQDATVHQIPANGPFSALIRAKEKSDLQWMNAPLEGIAPTPRCLASRCCRPRAAGKGPIPRTLRRKRQKRRYTDHVSNAKAGQIKPTSNPRVLFSFVGSHDPFRVDGTATGDGPVLSLLAQERFAAVHLFYNNDDFLRRASAVLKALRVRGDEKPGEPVFRQIRPTQERFPRDAQSVTSEFWLLFDPVKLDAMNEEDVTAFSEKMTGHGFQAGAVKEIVNWTGGVAPLVVWLLNQIFEANSAGAISQNSVNQAAHNIDDKCSGILDRLWADCAATTTDLYRNIVEEGESEYSGLPKQERTVLVDMGLIAQHSGKASSACRLMQTHVGGTNPELGGLARMFGNWDGSTWQIPPCRLLQNQYSRDSGAATFTDPPL